MMKFLLCSFFCVAILFSCKNDKPKGLLSEKKMQAVFTDIMKVDAYTKNFIAKDSQKNAILENTKMQMQVFALHKITKEEFYNSYEYYISDVKKMQPFMDSIINKANNERLIRNSPTSDPTKKIVEQ
ncbi:MAG: DUF4296 domain-containing protein [Ferruginibacter sp.]|nr:DUF4296 domain-containing protein [Ferruginibacter sp.]